MSISVLVLGRDEHAVRQIEGYRGELIVVRVCDEPAEAVAACATGGIDVLLVSEKGLLPPMEQVDDLAGYRTVVVLLDEHPDSVLSPGILAVPPDLGMGELEERIAAALQNLSRGEEPEDATTPVSPEHAVERSGRIVCFWGAVGSPGRSTVALNYAAEAAAAGRSVVLLDADTYGASLAIQLGLLDESASIAQLCRIVDSGSRDPARLNAACLSVQVGSETMLVATGIPRASRWPEVRGSALRRAATILRGHHDLVVLDLSAVIETDEQLSFDTQAPQRNGVTVEMLQCADEIYMIVAADSLGLPRALRALDELEERVPGIELKIVFNKIAVGNSGRSPKRRVMEAWDRFGPAHPVVGTLPNDNTVCHASILAGSPLLEIAPKSSLRSSIQSLTGIKSTVLPPLGRSRRFAKIT